ncbi:hypothetical protein [Agrobacterium sp. NPDC090283]|uniref:vWA domain-containing protein n=1 Tax=Agrobacterium sp. NPDC090283 TaxID=3363920 RepID=UPI00383BF1A4
MSVSSEIQFAENPEDRVPVILIVDVSPSMEDKIAELNDGYSGYIADLLADPLASLRVELAIVTCGDGNRFIPFDRAENHRREFQIDAAGSTPLGGAVTMALHELELRKQEYKRNGINYYRPWLWIMSDGEPNDDNWRQAAANARKAEEDKKVSVYCVGIGDAQGMVENLREFSPTRTAKLDKLKFREMFKWLSNSQKKVSQDKATGAAVQLDPVTDWATAFR